MGVKDLRDILASAGLSLLATPKRDGGVSRTVEFARDGGVAAGRDQVDLTGARPAHARPRAAAAGESRKKPTA